jgi:hypothetical protein
MSEVIESTAQAQLDAIDRATLTPLVQNALNSDTIEVVDWRCTPLKIGGGQYAGVLGVYRFSGHAQDQITQQKTAWSMILKAFGSASAPGGSNITAWDYWKREVLAYGSGLLVDLPQFLSAPRCYGVVERPDNVCWVWLEDLGALLDQAWSWEHYGVAATYLGQFNGSYLVGEPIPDVPWLSRGRARDWVDLAAPVAENLHSRNDELLVRRWLGDDQLERAQQLWSNRERLLEGLDALPRCLCHHDAFSRNLMLREVDGNDGLVAIDWSLVGTGPIGAEIAPLVGVSLQFFEVEIKAAQELDQLVFEGYLAGLRDLGWRGDVRVVRFGYAATLATFLGLGSLAFLDWAAEQPREQVEAIFGHPIDAILINNSVLESFLLDLGDEARELMDVVG